MFILVGYKSKQGMDTFILQCVFEIVHGMLSENEHENPIKKIQQEIISETRGKIYFILILLDSFSLLSQQT